jgi:transposase
MLRALLAGERDPATRAACQDDRSHASPHTSATSREGNGRDAWLCHLRQSRARDACSQQTIAACDTPIEAHRLTVARTSEGSAPPLPTLQRRPQNARRHEPHLDLHTQLYRLSGVDLTRLDGLAGLTAQPRLAASGRDLSRWQTEQPVAAWLGGCPDHRLSGGNGLTRGTRDVVNRAAAALRLAAQPLLHRTNALGAHDRRLRARLGAPTAITAMAHQLARLVSRLRTFGQPDVDNGLEHDAARCRQQRLPCLPRQARAVNRPLVPNQPVPSAVS